jgi:glutamyl-tRNA reductase
MVLGEMQILSQIKGAQEEARSLGFIGPVLSKVFATAHRVGKQARIQTAISCNSSSVSSAAVVLAKTHVGGDLSACDVTVVGIGEMGELALKTLHARGARRFHIVNRTIERANKIATHIAEYAGATCSAHGLDELSEVLARTDAVITAAGGGACIVNAETAARVMGNRSGRRLVVVDIGVPRNVDPKASAIEGFQLLDSDDIKAMQDDALESRRNEVPKVMAIIDEEMSRLEASLRKLCMQPLIDALRQKAEAIRQHELERTYHRLGSPDPVMWSHVQHFSEALVKKLFHDPTICIQEKAALESADFYAATIRELFGLNKER